MKQSFFICLLLVLCNSSTIFSQNNVGGGSIIPLPAKLQWGSGTFEITSATRIIPSDGETRKIARFFIHDLKQAGNIAVQLANKAPVSNYIIFKTDRSLKPEHYRLSIRPERIVVTASGYNGFLYAMQTVKQLLPAQVFSKTIVSKTRWFIPSAEIEDGPRFAYRGLMLDLSRHFFSIEYVKTVIDRMAEHKINTLHFHAIDDQGWRIEIKSRPRLTEVGAYRAETRLLTWNEVVANEPAAYPNYGGFYSQQQLKELVEYAADKGIRLIPEIEMPGHVTSSVASYPFLSCTGKEVLVPNGGVLPPFLNILCAGKESTYSFIKDVLTEVAAVFPSPYIHVGGDEVTKTNWKQCNDCQKKIKEQGLKNEEELETYFMARVHEIVKGLNKKMIVWKERSKTPEGVIPMVYKNVNETPAVTADGYQVIVAPASHTYFDFYQGMHSQEPLAYGGRTYLSQVYAFNPVLDNMSAQQEARVLGGQANLWAEFVHDEHTSEYMLYPRLAALSESLWSPVDQKNWADFSRRMMTQYDRYAFANLYFAKSALNVDYTIKQEEGKKLATVHLRTEFPTVTIRYEINGAVTPQSREYKDSLQFTDNTEINARSFLGNKPVGKLLKLKVEVR